MSSVDCSIIVPVYFNEESLHDTFEELSCLIDLEKDRRFEIVFVDDGSGDASLQVLKELRGRDPDLVQVIQLSRNFGQISAIMAGIANSRGESLVVMSADGQDPPELISQMLDARDTSAEVIIAFRESRDENLYRTLTSRFFYAVARYLGFPNMPLGGFDFVCLSRRAANILLNNREAHPFFQGQVLWLGLQPVFIGYRRKKREKGRSRYSFSKKLTYLIDGVLSYSFLPLRVMSLTGLIAAAGGFAYALIILLAKLTSNVPVEGWAPLMIVILVMGGLQMLMTGTIGEYLWRTLAQVRGRDPYIIQNVWRT